MLIPFFYFLQTDFLLRTQTQSTKVVSSQISMVIEAQNPAEANQLTTCWCKKDATQWWGNNKFRYQP